MFFLGLRPVISFYDKAFNIVLKIRTPPGLNFFKGSSAG